jgi:hypothetical protein
LVNYALLCDYIFGIAITRENFHVTTICPIFVTE